MPHRRERMPGNARATACGKELKGGEVMSFCESLVP
jgi:hypothetical protein